MLLIGGCHFQVEVVKVGVFVGIEEREVVGQGSDRGDSAVSSAEMDLEHGVIGPGGKGVLRSAFHGESGREMIRNLILLH